MQGTNSTVFKHVLQTRSGFTEITFVIADHFGQMEFDARWMGSDALRYRFSFRHKRFSDQYGIFHLEQIER